MTDAMGRLAIASPACVSIAVAMMVVGAIWAWGPGGGLFTGGLVLHLETSAVGPKP